MVSISITERPRRAGPQHGTKTRRNASLISREVCWKNGYRYETGITSRCRGHAKRLRAPELNVVRDAKEDMYWISETPEDKHLKALFGVIAEKFNQNLTKYHVFTSVKYLHWTGPVYFNLIRPFHHMVVWSMMKAGIKKRQIT